MRYATDAASHRNDSPNPTPTLMKAGQGPGVWPEGERSEGRPDIPDQCQQQGWLCSHDGPGATKGLEQGQDGAKVPVEIDSSAASRLPGVWPEGESEPVPSRSEAENRPA